MLSRTSSLHLSTLLKLPPSILIRSVLNQSSLEILEIQNAHDLLNAFMASRGSPGVLESVSSISLNTLHDANPPLKKRKTCHTGAGDLAISSIVIRVG